MLSLRKSIAAIPRGAFCPYIATRLSSNFVRRETVGHRLTMPISLHQNDKIEAFINFLKDSAPSIGIPTDMVYGGRLEDMSYKLSPVTIKDPTDSRSSTFGVSLETVQQFLDGLQPAIQEIRGDATGPLRIPLGRLITILSKEEPGKASFLALKPSPGPEADTLRSVLELITIKLAEARITPPGKMWQLKDPALNADRISNIHIISGMRRSADRNGLRAFDVKPVFELEGLKQWGFNQSDESVEIDLGEIYLPGIQLWKGAAIVGERRTLATEIKF